MIGKLQYQKLDNTTYKITDKDDKSYGVFSMWRVPEQQTQYVKNMDLVIHQDVADEIWQSGKFSGFLKIFRFVFDSVLEITENEKLKRCKIYSDDALVKVVYRKFADNLDAEKFDVKLYKNWIDIRFLK